MHYTSIQITAQSRENAKVLAIDAREKLLLVEINVSSPFTPWPKCHYVINSNRNIQKDKYAIFVSIVFIQWK